MGSRLLTGSPQLSVRVTVVSLILIASTVIPGTISGISVIYKITVETRCIYIQHTRIVSYYM